MSISNYVPKHRRKLVSLMLHQAKAKLRMDREPDADTLRMRAIYDAKGQVLREGVTYTATSERPWAIRRAVHGRVNQVELVVAGAVRKCGSMRKANSAARMGAWTG